MTQRLHFLPLTLLLLTGCWTGGALRGREIAYKHEAVTWIYRTGGQIGVFGILLLPIGNDLLDLQPGDGCVHVREGHLGGQCSAAPQARLQVSHVLDLQSGGPAFGRSPARHIDHAEPNCADRGHCERAVDDRLSVYSAGETGRLYLRLPSEVLVLHAKYPDPNVTFEPWLGAPIAAFRTPGDLLVVGLSQGYVVCIDMNKLLSGTPAPTPPAPGPSAK